MQNRIIPEPVTRVIEAFSRLPGIGPKSASRLTYFLLSAPDEYALKLAEALSSLKSQIIFCSTCYNITVNDPCSICSDSRRDQHKIVVVERPLDVMAIERTGIYDGLYHVLHGAISPVNGIGPDNLRIKELVERVSKGQVVEVIVATNPGQEGDATHFYIKEKALVDKGVKITRLARGLPVGGDIEYVDAVTLSRALQGRSEG
jgi:recombination protein RecR